MEHLHAAHRLSVFETLGNHTQGERLHARNGLISILAVNHDAGLGLDFGRPAAVILGLDFDNVTAAM